MQRTSFVVYLKCLNVVHDKTCHLDNKDHYSLEKLPSIKKVIVTKILKVFEPVYTEIDEFKYLYTINNWNDYIQRSKAIKPFLFLTIVDQSSKFEGSEFNLNKERNDFVKNSGLPLVIQKEITDLFDQFLKLLIIGTHSKKYGFSAENINTFMLILNIICEFRGYPLFNWE